MSVLVSESSKVIWVNGEISSDDYGDEFVTPSAMREALNLFKGKQCHVVINSPGGCAISGLVIHNEMKRNPKAVAIASGTVASAATVVYLGAKRRLVEKHAQFMTHPVWVACAGDARKLREMVDRIERCEIEYVDVYASVLGISQARAQAMIASENWYSADEMIELGISSGYFTDFEVEEPAQARSTAGVRAAVKPGSAEDYFRRPAMAHLRPGVRWQIASRMAADAAAR